MTTTETRMTMIFNEWAVRYAANPDEFSEILGDDGKPVTDYGENCMRYLIQVATEMDDAGLLPPIEGLNQEELYFALGKLVDHIEACGASTELTNAVVLAHDIRQAVGNQFNEADGFAADRVRSAV
ncbi:MAG: hypothetical protein V4733_03590 [Verrucomicrobiota bacterium]